MKKIFFALMIMAVSVTGLYAIGPTTLDSDFIVTIDNSKFTDTKSDKVMSTARLTGLGPSVGITTMLNNNFGLYGSIGTSFAIKNEIGDKDGNNMTEIPLKGDYDKTLIILTNFFMGPCIKPLNNSNGYLAINPGIHVKVQYQKNTHTTPLIEKVTTTENTKTMVGAGASIAAGFKVNRKFDIHAKCDIYYDFYSSNNEGIKGFIITPAIGLGTTF